MTALMSWIIYLSNNRKIKPNFAKNIEDKSMYEKFYLSF